MIAVMPAFAASSMLSRNGKKASDARTEPFAVGRIEVLEDILPTGAEVDALVASVRQQANRVIELSPNTPDEAAQVLNSIHAPGALADLKKAVELKPELPDAWAYYGQALLRTGDPETATEAYRKALAANPYSFTANMQMAILLKESGDMPGALDCLRRAQQVRPKDLGLRYQFAAIALQQGNLDSARRSLEEIVKESPSYTEAHVTLATIYYRLKRKEDGDREPH